MKFMLGIIAALGVAFAAYAAAATLSVNGGTVQAGEDNALTCTDAVQVEGWGLEQDTGEVSSVRISGLGTCTGNDLLVNITDAGGGQLTTCRVQPITQDEESCSFAANQQAEAVHDIHVFIEGPSGTADD